MAGTYKTAGRQRLLAYLSSHPDRHVTVDELASELAASAAPGDKPIGKSTLYRQLAELCAEGIVRKYRADTQSAFVYQYLGTGDCGHHFHLKCVVCGQDVRYKRKMCRACFEKDLAIRRAQGDAYRAGSFDMDRSRVLFFDLELTGFYDRDEILSITIVDGFGELIMDTLVKPTHTSKWNKTEKIHGITPDMVQDAPTLAELTPRIKEIFAAADHIIAYGVSTDYSHIKYIYDTPAEREALHDKVLCCANEFVRYTHEVRPDIVHASLTDAMACFEIEWDGVAHTSIADTIGCMKVWEKLFPNYYKD